MASTLRSLAGTDDGTDAETGALPQNAPDEEVASYSPRAYERLSKMLQELRKQRVGPSESEKWWALASALATPVARGQGRFGQVLGNVAQSMTAYEGARSKENKEKDALIAKYELGLAQLEDKDALAKLKAAGGAEGTVGGSVRQYQDPTTKEQMQSVLLKNGYLLITNLSRPEQPSKRIYVGYGDGSAPTGAPSAAGPAVAPGAPAAGALSATGAAAAPVAAPKAPVAAAAPEGMAAPAAATQGAPKPISAYPRGSTVDGSMIAADVGGGTYTPGIKYLITAEGAIPQNTTGQAVPTRVEPTGLGGEQVLDRKTGEWRYRAGQSPEELEAAGRAEARRLGVPYVPPPISVNQTPAQRGAVLKNYIEQGTKTIQAINEETKASNKMRADAEAFLAINKRSSGLTGPIRGRVSGVVPTADVSAMQGITQRMKVESPRTPGSISNYEDAGLERAVPNIKAGLRSNTILTNRIRAYNQLQNEYRDFATAWQRANRGSMEGMDAVWSKYVAANPIFDRSNPNGVANALPNKNRQSWKTWSRKTFYPTWEEWSASARRANPGASNAELRAFYDKKYGGR